MKKIYILGTKINDLSLDDVINQIKNHLNTQKKGYIVTPNPEICLLGYKNKQFRRILKHSFISIPDGFGLKLIAPLWGHFLNNTTTGIDLTKKLLTFAEKNNYSILLLGGEQKIGLKALKNINKKHPELTIQYINGGNFNQKGETNKLDLISQINNLAPDIILVNLGAPKQEYFMVKNIDKLNTKLMLGVGGSIDFIAEKIKRAPQIWRKIGLEWLWRLIQEPWRWPRIINAVIIFPLACIYFKIHSQLFYRKNVAGFIINNDKKILITKHAHKNYWQLPQGGAKNAKSKQELAKAIMREMKQELGTAQFQIIKMLKNCYKYNWPKTDNNFDHFKGEKQTLFLLKFTGNDNNIKLDPREHSQWQWINKTEILDLVPDFKKPLIKMGLENFKNYL
jgi:N-acetylglucosaminyldiphosphoundecaprenol N-acetyl-beta-D-mannosaminyltransferase